MIVVSYSKSADSKLDYTFDWSNWLISSEISSSSWSSDTGVTLSDEGTTANSAFVYVSGGTSGQQYTITNTIVTNDDTPKTDTRSFLLKVTD